MELDLHRVERSSPEITDSFVIWKSFFLLAVIGRIYEWKAFEETCLLYSLKHIHFIIST